MRPGGLVRTLVLAAAALAALAGTARADPQEVVDGAARTIGALIAHPSFSALRTTLEEARGVVVFPTVVKAGFIFGAEGGNGVLLARTADGGWSAPAFYTLGAASFGLQVGVQAARVVLVVMTEKGLQSVIDDQVKLGADLSLALGPIGGGVEASTTTNLGADVYAFAKSEGLFGGIAFEGALLYGREDLNRAYYGEAATAREIVLEHRFANPDAGKLKAALATP